MRCTRVKEVIAQAYLKGSQEAPSSVRCHLMNTMTTFCASSVSLSICLSSSENCLMAPHVLCGEFEEFSSLIEKKKKDQFFVSALQYQHNDYHPQQKLGSAF